MKNKPLNFEILKHIPIQESPTAVGSYLPHLIFSKITEDEFNRRKGFTIEGAEVPEILKRFHEISQEKGIVSVKFFDGTVIKGRSLGIEPDFDDEGEILGYYVLGIKQKNGKVVLIPAYLDLEEAK